MFTVKRTVTNSTDQPVTLYPYGLISRWGTPPTLGYYILHEGPIGVLDGQLQEYKYSAVAEDGPIDFDSTGGWLGITDKYWLASLVPPQDLTLKAGFRHQVEGDRFQTDYRGNAMTAGPRRRPSSSPTACSPAPRWSRCSTSTAASSASRCSTARSISAGSTS